MIIFQPVLVIITVGTFFIAQTTGIVDLEEYCDSFGLNFRPIICLLRQTGSTKSTSTTEYPILNPDYNSHHHHNQRNPDYWTEDSDEEDCCCDMWCFPTNSTTPANISATIESIYRCNSCGTECNASTSRNSLCTCAVLGSSQKNTTCTCTALCASFRHEESSESNCIFNVDGLMDSRLVDEQRPYTCECRKSKVAENNSNPFFVCVCQRVNT